MKFLGQMIKFWNKNRIKLELFKSEMNRLSKKEKIAKKKKKKKKKTTTKKQKT